MKQRIVRHVRYCPIIKQKIELVEGQQSSGKGVVDEWVTGKRNCSHAFDCNGKGHDCRWAEGHSQVDPMQVPSSGK